MSRRTIGMLIFFGIFFTVYGLVNAYIFIRGWQAIPPGTVARGVYSAVFLTLALSFITGRFLERAWFSAVSETFVWIGSFWLAAMLYFFLAVLVLDVLRLLNFLIPFFPAWITADYTMAKERTAFVVMSAVVLILLGGHINAWLPNITSLTLAVPKQVQGLKSMNIVAVSDIHLGTIIGRGRLKSLVEKVNSFRPDLILLVGDIVDEDLGPVVRENLGAMLTELTARYGVLAVTGNHEYIGGADEACAYLTAHGVVMLRDSVVRLENGVAIVGREDRSIGQFAHQKRKPLEELMAVVDKRFPVILMDHQPFHLDEAVRQGIDLQLSGHTHHGQLWPFNFITKAIYEISRGYEQRGGTHFYVSTGFGTWGPPVRTGNRPEIVHIVMKFE